MRSGIYRIDNFLNGKCYIGSSIDLDRRRKEHSYHLLHNSHANKHLQNAYNKYGREYFEFTIVEIVEVTDNIKQNLLTKEQFWIDNLKPEYNILLIAGSNLGYNHTEETKQKISNSTIGIKKSKEHVKHIKDSQKGKVLSKEHKEKLSEAAKNRTKKCHVTKVSIDGIIYDSINDAAMTLDLHRCTIRRRLKNEKYPEYFKV